LPGTTATFDVSATGSGLNYQWYKNGNILVGETASSLVLTNVSAAKLGPTAWWHCICGNGATNSATLAIMKTCW